MDRTAKEWKHEETINLKISSPTTFEVAEKIDRELDLLELIDAFYNEYIQHIHPFTHPSFLFNQYS